MLRFVCALIAVVVLAVCLTGCGGDSEPSAATSTPSPASPGGDAGIGQYRKLLAMDFGPDSTVTIVRMTAAKASALLDLTGDGGFPIRPENYSCPPKARCPYPGEPPDEPGFLLIARAPHLSGPGEPTPAPGRANIYVRWCSDDGTTVSLRYSEQEVISR